MNIAEKKLLIGASGIFVLACVSILVFPWLFTLTAPAYWSGFDVNDGHVATTISGLSTPFIAIGAALLTFLAFFVQYKANLEQREFNTRQREDIAIERFETMFFEMMRFHRENLQNINSRDRTERQDLFITMFYELRFVYNVAINLDEANNKYNKPTLNKSEIFNIAYIAFFNGANPDTVHSLKMLFEKNKHQGDFFNELIHLLIRIRNEYRLLLRKESFPFPEMDHLQEMELYSIENGELVEHKGSLVYAFTRSNDNFSVLTINSKESAQKIVFWLFKDPFTGHTNELGHYFRHLFQTVQYLDNEIFGPTVKLYSKKRNVIQDDKPQMLQKLPLLQYNYLRMLRAQLSDFESLLLYYHSYSCYGNEWRDKEKGNLLEKFNLLKKIRLTSADFYIHPGDILQDTSELNKIVTFMAALSKA